MRQILLGRLHARRDGLRFVAEPASELVASPGEVVELVVRYEYDEPTLAQDHFEARLVVDPPAEPGAAVARMGDEPFAHDRANGALVRRLVVQGPAEVPFEVRATLGHRPWTARPGHGGGEQLVEGGVLRVRVSPR